MSQTSGPDPELEARLMLLDGPFGDDQHVRERDRAAEWLVAHGERAYPALIARLDGGRGGAGSVALLPRFARERSIATLARLLEDPGNLGWQAGQALAAHPQAAAGQALRQALNHPDPAVACNAADGLGARGDSEDCAALIERLIVDDAGLRCHVLQAAAQIGCGQSAMIAELARADPDARVRRLAGALLADG